MMNETQFHSLEAHGFVINLTRYEILNYVMVISTLMSFEQILINQIYETCEDFEHYYHFHMNHPQLCGKAEYFQNFRIQNPYISMKAKILLGYLRVSIRFPCWCGAIN